MPLSMLRLAYALAYALGIVLVATGGTLRSVMRGRRSAPSATTEYAWRQAARASRGAQADSELARAYPPSSYMGHDARGVPRYVRRPFTAAERQLLRAYFGIEHPNRLYLSDSTAANQLKYDTRVDCGARCFVNSYKVGFISIRHPGETWESFEQRLTRMRPSDFPPGIATPITSLAALDPAVRAPVERMLAAARRSGFRLRVTETYRSPEREAYLLGRGTGRTYTATSLHSYGRALDLIIDDGVLSHARTRSRWIAFRRWVAAYDSGRFRLIGTPARTWDWPHVEMPSRALGFHSIEELLAAARRCAARSAGATQAVGATAPECVFPAPRP